MAATNTYDAVIVGSGITGGWAAKELTEKGLSVLVLEAGRTILRSAITVEHIPAWELKFRGWDNRAERMATQPIQRECYYACDEYSINFRQRQREPVFHRSQQEVFVDSRSAGRREVPHLAQVPRSDLICRLERTVTPCDLGIRYRRSSAPLVAGLCEGLPADLRPRIPKTSCWESLEYGFSLSLTKNLLETVACVIASAESVVWPCAPAIVPAANFSSQAGMCSTYRAPQDGAARFQHEHTQPFFRELFRRPAARNPERQSPHHRCS